MRQNAARGALVFFAMFVLGCGSGSSSGLMSQAEGKLAPESATMKWEQEIRASTTPAHVIRRFTSPEPAAAVARFYQQELRQRGWQVAPGASTDYVEWSHDGQVLSLVFERPSGSGREWSLALFAAK